VRGAIDELIANIPVLHDNLTGIMGGLIEEPPEQ
jgi:hypothetical protein